MAKIFEEAPSQVWWFILIFGLVISTLFLDNQMGGSTNPIIFFISVVIFPITIAAIANRSEGGKFTRLLGFGGKPLFVLSMLLMSAGAIGLVFFGFTQPMSIMYRGSLMYSALTFMALPLSQRAMWFTTITPMLAAVFYITVAVGEEALKIFGAKTMSNFINEKFHGKLAKNLVISIAFLISLLGWMMCHIFSWGGLPLVGVLMGILLSVIFVMPLFFAEPIMFPESGYQGEAIFNIWAPIGGHFMYDFLLSLMQSGQLAIGLFNGMLMFGSILGLGVGLLVWQYMRRRGYGFFTLEEL